MIQVFRWPRFNGPAVRATVDWWDAVLAPVLLAWSVVADQAEPFSVALLLLTLPVLVRRRWPTGAAAATSAGIALSTVWPITSPQTAASSATGRSAVPADTTRSVPVVRGVSSLRKKMTRPFS